MASLRTTSLGRLFDRSFRARYPAQFWLMFWGMLISTMGASMIWPFLMIYVKERLGLGLTAAASLTSINSGTALLVSFLAGPVIDRVGRKWAMVISLAGLGSIYFFYPTAASYGAFAVLMVATGLCNPLYRVGGDAMVADLIPPEDRPDAYSLLRMANNAGIAIGPAIGGFAAAVSYQLAFYGAAVGMLSYALLMAFFGRETMPRRAAVAAQVRLTFTSLRKRLAAAYLRVFQDRAFLSFVIAFTFNQIATATIWVLLSVHAKNNYGVPENQFGFIPVTNALMVVFLQGMVTLRTKRHKPLPVLALGSLIYAIAATSVALGRGFWGFWLSMVIMTTGELMLMPTASTYTASLAPADMRGRYMSVFGLTWGVAQGVGPLLGGFLSDNYGPASPWLMGGLAGLISSLLFVFLATRGRQKEAELSQT